MFKTALNSYRKEKNKMILGLALGILAFIILKILLPSSASKPLTENKCTKVLTYTEILAEVEAKYKLEKDYKWVQPKYGMLYGKKIYNPTPEQLQNMCYRSPGSMGRWVKRGKE